MKTDERDVPELSPLDNRWLPPAEAAKYLGVEVGTLSKWRLRGIGPRYTAALKRDPRYRLSDLMAHMTSKMASNTREAKTVRNHQSAPTHYTLRRPARPARGGE